MDQADELRSFDRQVAAAGKRFESLLQKIDDSSDRLPATSDVIEELGTALEELHSASDEMNAQIEELAASRSALEEQQRRYQDLFEFAPDAYLVTDAQGFIKEANRAAGLLLHVQQDHLVDKPLANYMQAAEHQSFRTKLSHLAQGQISEWRDWKLHLQPRNGQITPVSVDVAVIEDEAGTRADLRWLMRDITERERSENLLQDSEALLERMFSTVDLSIAYMDKDFNYLRVNRAFADIDGRQPDFYVGKNHFDLSPDASQQAIFKQVVATGQAYTFNERLITDAGRSRQGVTYWNWSLRPVKDAMGESQGLVYSLADVTIRKEAEIALKAEREQRSFAESLVQATLALNSSLNLNEVLDHILEQIQAVIPFRSANIVLLDGETARISRYRGPGESRQPPAFLDRELSLDRFPMWKAIYESCQPVCVPDTHSEPRWNPSLGFDWPRSYLGVPLCINSTVVGLLNLLSDQVNFFDQEAVKRLTAFASQAALAIQNASLYKDLKHALEQEQATRRKLVQAEKFAGLGRMLASVAHELNNPLQTIKNCLYLTAQEAAPDAPMQEYMGMALEETNRLAGIVGQLRELYRPLPARTSHPHALNQILNEVHALLETQLKEKHVDWLQEGQPEELPVNCYPDQLKQVFINICVNAMEAMQPAGGRLMVRLRKSEDASQVGVIFQDTGPGMPPEVLNVLFEPFFTTKINGVGLGLSISYELVERHHGHISVESQVGQGTTFTIWLPLNR